MSKTRARPKSISAGNVVVKLDGSPASNSRRMRSDHRDASAVERTPAGDGDGAQAGSGQIVAALENHNQLILAAIQSVRDAERRQTEDQLEEQRRHWQRRLDESKGTFETALAGARADADEALHQLSFALEQLRRLTAQAESDRRELIELNDRVAVLTEGKALADQRAITAETSATQARSESESLRRIAQGLGGDSRFANFQAGLSAVGQWAAVVVPVQVTATVGTSETAEGSGIGIILDLRLAAAAPLDPQAGTDPALQAVELAANLARAIQPTAALTVLVEDTSHLAADTLRDSYPHITVAAVPADDRRQKAALILASAARRLGHGGTDCGDA